MGDCSFCVQIFFLVLYEKYAERTKSWYNVAVFLLVYTQLTIFLKGEKTNMRLDKYLKVSRLIKRRTIANEACDAGRVLINDKPAKASTNVKVGDIIEIGFGGKAVRVEVLDIQETTKKDEAKELFRYL